MSTCNCDGTVSHDAIEFLLGPGYDSVLSDAGISGLSIDSLVGGADPREAACQQAVGSLVGTGQDPCNLDSPDDLQVLYRQAVPQAWAVIKGTPLSNPVQKAFDIAAGSATNATPITTTRKASTTNWAFIIGAIIVLGIGFFLVFR